MRIVRICANPVSAGDMGKVKLTVGGYRCERCQHEWVPREDVEPRVCPKCKSPYWNRPRKTANGKRDKVRKASA
jgi:predicted Zn-ribbon and HTH transcriptional regulator